MCGRLLRPRDPHLHEEKSGGMNSSQMVMSSRSQFATLKSLGKEKHRAERFPDDFKFLLTAPEFIF